MKPLRGQELRNFLKQSERPRRDLAILLHDVEDPVNVGAAFRIADALKVSELVLTGITPTPPHRLIEKVGRKKDRRVPWRHVPDVVEALRSLRGDGYETLALELTSNARCYLEYPYSARTCLVVGHEDHGVTKRALEACDGAVFIPMYGKGASLNVSVALGVASFYALHAPLPS